MDKKVASNIVQHIFLCEIDKCFEIMYPEFPLAAHAGEPNTPYRIWPHHSWQKGRDHQPKKN
jgi:hypothetical protein